ncbi:MAG: hypothetical protein IKJ13_06025 [Clostridia bacterium]|nr:hypothetical protein [Clostridia bacterium]
MFKITPTQDKTRQKEICELCGAEFRPDALCYEMIDTGDGHLMGMAQFDLGKEGYIYDLKEANGLSDFEAMFILGRQTMNFIDSCGAHSCYASPDAGDEKLLHAIGFRKNDGGEYFRDMTGMFDGHCDGHEVKL